MHAAILCSTNTPDPDSDTEVNASQFAHGADHFFKQQRAQIA